MSTETFDGELLTHGAAGYERARRAAVWNAFTPPREPEAIVLARSERYVLAAVRLANDQNMKIGVRSGGHSWAGNHLRDGGMLLDLSQLRVASSTRRA